MTRLDALGNDEEQTVGKIEEIISVCNMCVCLLGEERCIHVHDSRLMLMNELNTKSGNEKVKSQGITQSKYTFAECASTQNSNSFM